MVATIFALAQAAKSGQEVVPPVLIIVCDNTDIAEIFFRNISGEREGRGRYRGRVRGPLLP